MVGTPRILRAVLDVLRDADSRLTIDDLYQLVGHSDRQVRGSVRRLEMCDAVRSWPLPSGTGREYVALPPVEVRWRPDGVRYVVEERYSVPDDPLEGWFAIGHFNDQSSAVAYATRAQARVAS